MTAVTTHQAGREVVKALKPAKRGLTESGIAKKTGLEEFHVSRALSYLNDRGYVSHHHGGRWTLNRGSFRVNPGDDEMADVNPGNKGIPARLRGDLAKINPSHYESQIPDMTSKDLEREHKAMTALIKRAERHPETGKSMVNDLRQLRSKIVTEKRNRRKSNPRTVARKGGKFHSTYTPSKDDLRLIKKYGVMKNLEGRSLRAVEAAILKLREIEKREIAAGDPILAKYAANYRRRRAAHMNLVTSPGSSPGAIARAKKQVDDSENNLILYAEIRNMDPADLGRFMDHAKSKQKAVPRKNPYTSKTNRDALALTDGMPSLGTLEAYPRATHVWESEYVKARAGGTSEGASKRRAWSAVKAAGYYEDSKGVWRMPRRRFNPGSHPKENPLKKITNATSEKQARATISKNISTEMQAGRPQRQAIAIALASARRDAPKLMDSMYGPRPRPNPKKASRTAKPEWKALTDRCKKLQDSYRKKPTKKNLRLVFDHLAKMKESEKYKTSKRVRDGRAACLRMANREAKRIKMKV